MAKYLTPNGRDIHKHGIIPDIKASISEKDFVDFSKSDLGTSKDTQYIVAETALVKAIRKANQGTNINNRVINIKSAL